MWLLENLGDLFEGRRLWLRPGKRYLFGRTASEPGQLAISHKTISRKHLTIEVGQVREGDGQVRRSRSTVTIEDLAAKMGTLVEGTQIRGQKHVLSGDSAEIKMGQCPQLFKITWQPVVLTFSFTNKELRADPWAALRGSLEQLDVKYIPDYDIALTTHVVTKKRNTSKGLQALINGRYIVTDTFISAIVDAATEPDGADSSGSSPLEQDFYGNWPNALDHLPPRGEEPTDRPAEAYAPDPRRQDIFEGYTFIFYDRKQHETLFSTIASGKGKVLFREVVPGETQIDDFIRYVKGVAGEKGLGEFEDGSEGRGVVVVRYLPAKGDGYEWYSEFMTAVSLRLDHRMIDQRDFLDAILALDSSSLRRPLEIELATQPEQAHPRTSSVGDHVAMDADKPSQPMQRQESRAPSVVEEEFSGRATRARGRNAARSRFRGFGGDVDSDDDAQPPQSSILEPSQEPASRRSQRKRPASPPMEEQEGDPLEYVAPTAAAIKRRRIDQGEDLDAPVEMPMDEDEEVLETPPNGLKKEKGEVDIMDMARKHREEAEARARAEGEALAQLPDDIDPAEIRRLAIVEEIRPLAPAPQRTRENDVADGRWDPSWNGRQNFKAFRKQGALAGRPMARVIVPLEEVKTKEYGIGDGYWLEDDSQRRKRKGTDRSNSQSQGQQVPGPTENGREEVRPKPKPARARARQNPFRESDSEEGEQDERDEMDELGGDTGLAAQPVAELEHEHELEPEPEPEPEPDLPRTRRGKAEQRAVGAAATAATTRRQTQEANTPAQTQSQTRPQTRRAQAQTQTQAGKRAAPAPIPSGRPQKKTRQAAGKGAVNRAGGHGDDDDEDDSDDGLRFRFGRRG